QDGRGQAFERDHSAHVERGFVGGGRSPGDQESQQAGDGTDAHRAKPSVDQGLYGTPTAAILAIRQIRATTR
ncbi:MAG: hypothetical protein RL233_1713, partial [Bacteroidota bacterium]